MTIFEYYGTGADYVGHKVAEALGLPFHQQAFSSEAIEAGKAAVDEEGAMLAQVFAGHGRRVRRLRRTRCRHDPAPEVRPDHGQQPHRWELADEGGVVLGRNGAVILAERPNTLHVLLTGAVEDRVERAARMRDHLEQAAKRQVHEDQVRADISRVLYGWDPLLPDRYDLVLNTSRIPLDAVVNAILDALRGGGA